MATPPVVIRTRLHEVALGMVLLGVIFSSLYVNFVFSTSDSAVNNQPWWLDCMVLSWRRHTSIINASKETLFRLSCLWVQRQWITPFRISNELSSRFWLSCEPIGYLSSSCRIKIFQYPQYSLSIFCRSCCVVSSHVHNVKSHRGMNTIGSSRYYLVTTGEFLMSIWCVGPVACILV